MNLRDIKGKNRQEKTTNMYSTIISKTMKKMIIKKWWSKFGQNPLNFMQQAKDFLIKVELFERKARFWSRNIGTGKLWRIFSKVS